MKLNRRDFLQQASAWSLAGLTCPATAAISFQQPQVKTRLIPASSEPLPVVGLGTWQQLDVSLQPETRRRLTRVLGLMHQWGGRVIDSSPMYGRSEAVIGELTSGLSFQNDFFYATKVWTSGKETGIRQMQDSFRQMKRNSMDLMQIHNLLDWQTHLPVLQRWKEEGRIRYIGITHYTVSRHDDLLRVLQSQPIDFIQVNYSMGEPEAGRRLLPAAADRGVAVLINRPYQGGRLFGAVKNQAIPEWARERGMTSWGKFFLGWILGHPAVTCAIPGTSDPEHLVDNMQAGTLSFPDSSLRDKMYTWFNNL